MAIGSSCKEAGLAVSPTSAGASESRRDGDETLEEEAFGFHSPVLRLSDSAEGEDGGYETQQAAVAKGSDFEEEEAAVAEAAGGAGPEGSRVGTDGSPARDRL